MRTFPGSRILSEDSSAAVLSEKPVLVSNPFVYTQLEKQIHWSQGTVAQLVDRRYFDLIALGGDVEAYKTESGMWPAAAISAIGRQYVVRYRFDCSPWLRTIYVPSAVQASE
jgi:hypothetical protein